MFADSYQRENSEQETSVKGVGNITKSSERTLSPGKKELTPSSNKNPIGQGQEVRGRSHNRRQNRHHHVSPAHHTTAIQRKFFALAADLSYNADEVKERATAYFSYECFNQITTQQMMILIDKMTATARAKGIDVDY